ncbi:MAG: hypothetical protein LUH19_09550, partial [Lachnospiraceae bacterium]|nr:hypothetical protein [Lachnospiraceae bacterium]
HKGRDRLYAGCAQGNHSHAEKIYETLKNLNDKWERTCYNKSDRVCETDIDGIMSIFDHDGK